MTRSPIQQIPRARFYEEGAYPWHIEMVPKTWRNPPEPHPAWQRAIFVVHGIGSQTQAEVAVGVRSCKTS